MVSECHASIFNTIYSKPHTLSYCHKTRNQLPQNEYRETQFGDVLTAELVTGHIINFFILTLLKRINQINIHNSRETLWLSFSCFADNPNRHTELHDWYCKHTGMTLNLMMTHIKMIRPSYHNADVIMGAMVSQITSLTIVCSNVYSGADQRKHQSSASPAFVWGIHRWQVNSPHKGPVTWKTFPFDDSIMIRSITCNVDDIALDCDTHSKSSLAVSNYMFEASRISERVLLRVKRIISWEDLHICHIVGVECHKTYEGDLMGSAVPAGIFQMIHGLGSDIG